MNARGLAIFVALFTACDDDGGPPAVRVESVRDMGPLETSAAIRGRDGGYSAAVFGRSVWLYGDTILATPDASGGTWHNSSMSFTGDFDAADGVTGFRELRDSVGAPRLFLQPTDAEAVFNAEHATTDQARWVLWPGAVVDDPARNRALVFYVKVLAYPGPFNFQGVGASLAVWTDLTRSPERPTVMPGRPDPRLLFGPGEPALGEGAVVVDDLLYAFDCRGADKACIVARVPLADALDRSAWRFFDGDDWTSAWQQAAEVLRGHDIMSVHYNADFDTFIAVYSEPVSNRVLYRTAPAPEGPWSRATLAFSALAPTDGDGTVSYSAVAHAELAKDGVEFVTYHRGLAPFASEIRMVEMRLTAF